MPILTQEKHDLRIALWEQGLSNKEIGKRIGVRREAIDRWLRIQGKKPNGKPRKRLGKTLCWDCKKAVCGCKWSKTLKPDYENWIEYEETELQHTGREDKIEITKSFRVIKCKLFEKD